MYNNNINNNVNNININKKRRYKISNNNSVIPQPVYNFLTYLVSVGYDEFRLCESCKQTRDKICISCEKTKP